MKSSATTLLRPQLTATWAHSRGNTHGTEHIFLLTVASLLSLMWSPLPTVIFHPS